MEVKKLRLKERELFTNESEEIVLDEMLDTEGEWIEGIEDITKNNLHEFFILDYTSTTYTFYLREFPSGEHAIYRKKR